MVEVVCEVVLQSGEKRQRLSDRGTFLQHPRDYNLQHRSHSVLNLWATSHQVLSTILLLVLPLLTGGLRLSVHSRCTEESELAG